MGYPFFGLVNSGIFLIYLSKHNVSRTFINSIAADQAIFVVTSLGGKDHKFFDSWL